MSEGLYCLLSYSSELENKSNDMNSLLFLIFDNICELAEKYPGLIEYREELEVLMFRILLRPIQDKDETEEKVSISLRNLAKTNFRRLKVLLQHFMNK